MRFDILKSVAELDLISSEWNELLSCCSASHVPFLRYEYLKTWWETLGGGEWQDGELYVVTAREEGDRLLGIAPLFFTRNRDAEPALLLLGSIEISDYLDLIVDCDHQASFIDELLGFLDSDRLPAWNVLDWYNLPDYSPTLVFLQESAERRGWAYQQERLQPCPYIRLPGDWELYLAGIDKKQRHEIRRKMRRAEESELHVRWYIVQDESRLDSEVDGFMDLMAQDPEKANFLSQEMRSQMRAAVHTAYQNGWLQLAFLEVDGQKAAGYLNFDFNDHIWVYNSGLSSNFRELSPGWVLLGHLLKWANENNRHEFDFLRGNEEYKYRFGAVDRFVVRAIARRQPLTGG
jgi:CelD/BcsL family acetyltransferase involved in cellulose biosynthesis